MKSVTVLKLKLADHADLERIGQFCRKARNVAVTNWLMRQHGFPESHKQQFGVQKRSNDKPLSESTKCYHCITEAVPELGTTQASCIAGMVMSALSAKVDWREAVESENGKQRRRKDAVLSFDERPPFFTKLEIPLHNQHMRVRFTDRLVISIERPLRSIAWLDLEVSLRDLPPGIQLILRTLADGTRKLQDSRLVQKEDAWYWHVPVSFESDPLSDTEATLWPTLGSSKDGKQSDRPFRLELPGRTWYVGDGRYLLAQTQRLIGLRKMIGWRYRQRMGAGHGRAKIDAAVRRRRKQEQNMRIEVRRRIITDIIRQCVKHNIGKIVYREPSLTLRKKCWFASNDLDWDWSRIACRRKDTKNKGQWIVEGDLPNACRRHGIEVVIVPYLWKEAFPNAAEKDSAVSGVRHRGRNSKPKAVSGNGKA